MLILMWEERAPVHQQPRFPLPSTMSALAPQPFVQTQIVRSIMMTTVTASTTVAQRNHRPPQLPTIRRKGNTVIAATASSLDMEM